MFSAGGCAASTGAAGAASHPRTLAILAKACHAV